MKAKISILVMLFLLVFTGSQKLNANSVGMILLANSVWTFCKGLRAGHDRVDEPSVPIGTQGNPLDNLPLISPRMFIDPQPMDHQIFFADHPKLEKSRKVQQVLRSENASHFHFEEGDAIAMQISSGETANIQKISPLYPETVNSVYWNLFLQSWMHIALHLKKDGKGIVEIGPGLETLSLMMNNGGFVVAFKAQYKQHLGFKKLKKRFDVIEQFSFQNAKITISLKSNKDIKAFLIIIGEHFPL